MVHLHAPLPTVYTVATVVKAVGQQYIAKKKKTRDFNSLFCYFVNFRGCKKNLTLEKIELYN